MEKRSSIFSARGDGEVIGYIEGAEAFNVSGQRRCRYDGQTGNLRDLRNGEIVGHVSLEGKFVGLSWRADKLFQQFDDDIDGAVLQDEASPDGVGEQPAGQELAPGEDESPKSADNHTDALGQMLRELVQEEASPDGVGEQHAGQEQAPAEDESPKGADGDALHPLRQVLAVANEVFGQRDAEGDQGVRNVGERRSPPSEKAEPAIPTNSDGEQREAERIFEMLRNRIGLSARDVRDVEEMPNPGSEQEEPNIIPTSSAGEQSGAFSEEVEHVFEMLLDRIGLNTHHVHNGGEMPNPLSEQAPAEQIGPHSQEVERVFEMLRDKELD